MSRSRKRLLAAAAAAVALLGAWGHLAWHYGPRVRPATPDPEDLPGALLADARYEACLWLPYPHQNLGALAREVEDPAAYLAAVAEAAGLDQAPAIPSFGPFRAPPAKELALAFDLDGGRFAAAARVYPGLALVARLAGTVARNPWLAGGEVEAGHRLLRVRWEGTLWVVEPAGQDPEDGAAAPDAPDPSAVPAGPDPPADLARFRIARDLGWLPAGAYRLSGTPEGLRLTSAGGPSGSGPPAVDDSGRGPAAAEALLGESAVAVTYDSGRRRGRELRAAALFAGGSRHSLPPTAVFGSPGGGRWKLPAEGLLSRITGDLPAAEAAGLRVVASDGEGLRLGTALAPRLARLGSAPLSRGLWLRPGPAHATVASVAARLEEIPIVGPARARRWQAWATLLAPLARYRSLSLEVDGDSGTAHLTASR